MRYEPNGSRGHIPYLVRFYFYVDTIIIYHKQITKFNNVMDLFFFLLKK